MSANCFRFSETSSARPLLGLTLGPHWALPPQPPWVIAPTNENSRPRQLATVNNLDQVCRWSVARVAT